MSRVPIRELEELRLDPLAYRQKIATGAARFFKRSYFNVLRDAIFRFHRGGADRVAARPTMLTQLVSFKNVTRRAETVASFDWYVNEFAAAAQTTFATKVKVRIPLPSRVGTALHCDGQVERVDLCLPSGYSVWMFRSADLGQWDDELRMPLIQEAVSSHLNVSPSEVEIGVYSFGEHSKAKRKYTSSEIQSAKDELDQLLSAMGY